MPLSVIFDSTYSPTDLLDNPLATTVDEDIPVWNTNKKLKTSGLTNMTTLNASVSTNTTNITTLQGVIDGNENTKLGTSSGSTLSTGSSNTLIGLNAGDSLTTADNCVIVGKNADASTGSNNVVVGSSSGNSGMTGVNNVIVGPSCSSNMTSGSNNVMIGNGCVPDSSAVTYGNMIGVGYGVTTRNVNEVALGNSSVTHIRSEANCDVGTSSYPMKDLYLNGNIKGCTGIVTNMKFKHSTAATVTLGDAYAKKINDMIELHVPAFDITTVAETADIVGQIVITSALLPKTTSSSMTQFVMIGSDICYVQLALKGSILYLKMNKVNGGAFTATTATCTSFMISFQAANTTVLASTQQWSTLEPYSPPTVISYAPVDNGYSGTTNDMVLTFNENIQVGSAGNVYLYNSADTLLETVAYNDAKLTFSTTQLTINFAAVLVDTTNYYILIDADVITDTEGASFPGITDKTTWNFTCSPFPTYLSDTTASAVLGLAVGKIKSSYSGACMRIRESGGDTLLDIGFDASGRISEAEFDAHVGANSGYVHTWYDQSGNGNNLTQTTNSKQPQLVFTSQKANINYDGSNDRLDSIHGSIALSTMGLQNATSLYYSYKSTSGSNQYPFSSNDFYHESEWNSTQVKWYAYGTNLPLTAGSVTHDDGNLHVFQMYTDTTNMTIDLDPTQSPTVNATIANVSASVSDANFNLGGRHNDLFFFTGSINTFVAFSSDIGSTDRGLVNAGIYTE